METYERWEPIAGIEAPFADVEISYRGPELTLCLVPTPVYGGKDRDLILRFGQRIIALMSHGEFEHPWNDPGERGPIPRADNPPPYTFAFPLLRVIDSEWVASFFPSRLDTRERPTLTHYRIITLADTLDVLTQGPVSAEWSDEAS
jgi:hypothetical protein